MSAMMLLPAPELLAITLRIGSAYCELVPIDTIGGPIYNELYGAVRAKATA